MDFWIFKYIPTGMILNKHELQSDHIFQYTPFSLGTVYLEILPVSTVSSIPLTVFLHTLPRANIRHIISRDVQYTTGIPLKIDVVKRRKSPMLEQHR